MDVGKMDGWMDVSMNVRRIGGCWLDRWML
jgi:hypothetical protein